MPRSGSLYVIYEHLENHYPWWAVGKFGKAFIAGENSPSTGFHVAGRRDLRDSMNRIFESSVNCIQEATFHALSFSPHDNPTGKILLFQLYRWERCGLQKLKKFPKATQLKDAGTGLCIRAFPLCNVISPHPHMHLLVNYHWGVRLLDECNLLVHVGGWKRIFSFSGRW